MIKPLPVSVSPPAALMLDDKARLDTLRTKGGATGPDRREATVDGAARPDFAAIYEAMPAAAFLIDIDSGRILHGNLAAQQLSGHNRSQLAGRKAARLFPRSELGRFWENAGDADAAEEFIGWILTRNQCEVPVSAMMRQLPGSRHCVLLAFDITELKLSMDGLSERVRVDALTGLMNREQFEAELSRRLERLPTARALALMQIDIDDLRRVNEAFGYGPGDRVLAAMAQRLLGVLGDHAQLARRGGDNFVALFSDLPANLLESRRLLALHAEAALAAVREPFVVDGAAVALTCSIGLALAPHDANAPASLLHCADLALQQGRRQRSDGYRFFIEGDLRRHDDEIRIESLLRESLRRNEVEQAWLPIFRLQDEACVGIECLLRAGPSLRGHDTGRVVAVAEARGLLPALGRATLHHALHGWSQLVSAGREPALHQLNLNVTVQELAAPGYVDELLSALSLARLPRDRVMLEIAERDLFAGLDRARASLERLQQAGVRLAIDGFGSGFSSLALLRDLPVALIKIDRGFVWQLEASQRDRDIVRAMIQLAHSMNVRAAAIGVETRAQLQALRGMGCDLVQGYLLSRPLPLDDLNRFLRPHAARQR